MSYKKNFKGLIIGHFITMVLLVVLILVIGANNILYGLVAGMVISLVLQVILYVIRPQLFNSKADKYLKH